MEIFDNFLSPYYSWREAEDALNILVREINELRKRINELEKLNRIVGVQVSDTTEGDSSNAV